MNLDQDFVQVWKFSEDQKKKCKWNTFFPKFRWRPKKRSSSKIEHFFFPNSGEDQKKVFIKNRTLFFPNSGEDQKKKEGLQTKTEHFFSQIQVKTKKKRRSSNKNRTLFSQNFRSDVHPFKLLGGCRCGPFSNYWGDTAKYLPHPSLVSAPLDTSNWVIGCKARTSLILYFVGCWLHPSLSLHFHMYEPHTLRLSNYINAKNTF